MVKLNLNPNNFKQMMREIKRDAEERQAQKEFDEVPEEIMAEMSVRRDWPKLSPEVREKIRNGEPF